MIYLNRVPLPNEHESWSQWLHINVQYCCDGDEQVYEFLCAKLKNLLDLLNSFSRIFSKQLYDHLPYGHISLLLQKNLIRFISLSKNQKPQIVI